MAKAQGIASGVLTITINRACPLLLLWPESSIKSDQSKHLCQEIPSEQAHQAWQNNDTMVYSSQVARKFMCYFLYPQFLVDHFTFHIQNTNLFKIWNRICFTETVPLLLVLLRKNLGSQLFLMWKTWSKCPGSQQHINLFFSKLVLSMILPLVVEIFWSVALITYKIIGRLAKLRARFVYKNINFS